jgi:L-lysine 2,3-aminomutase
MPKPLGAVGDESAATGKLNHPKELTQHRARTAAATLRRRNVSLLS